MKKIIILSIILILGLSLVAFAVGAQKLVFVQEGACEATGFVILNTTPDGNTITTIEIQVRGLAEEEYQVKSGGAVLGTFVTNKKGNGNFHLNLQEGGEVLGAKINIRTMGNTLLLYVEVPI